MNEQVMQAVLLDYAMDEKKHDLAVPNITSLYSWEADLISITNAKLVHEYEIKISLADYNRDFEKRQKHRDIVEQWTFCPNYFWYATWGFEIQPPSYAGWLEIVYVPYRLTVVVRKEAPRLHDTKILDAKKERIGRLLAFRLKNMYQRFYTNEWYGGMEKPKN